MERDGISKNNKAKICHSFEINRIKILFILKSYLIIIYKK